IEYIDNKIAKRITGQTLTNGNQKYGSRSLGEVHERAGMRVSKRDARMVHKTLNDTLFKWIFLANGRKGSLKIRVDEDAYKELVNNIVNEPTTVDKPTYLSDAPGKHLCLL
ncbi:DUF935 family protein, partial [Vibrio sp. 10N.222.49.A3]